MGLLELGWKSLDSGMEVWIVDLLDSRGASGVEMLKFVSEDKNLMSSNLFLPRPTFSGAG